MSGPEKTGAGRDPGSGIALSSSGFTLLELIISISIIALIVLIIAGAMRLAHHSVESGEKKADLLERVRGSFSVINAQVQSQVPLTYMDDAEKKFYFTGQRELMTLATNYSIWAREKGYSVVTYKVDTDSDGKKFMTASEHTIGLEGLRETTLLTGCDSIYFEYFYKGPTDEEGSWIEEWTEKTAVPEKMFLHVIMDKKDLSMIIPMRTTPTQPSQAAQGAVPAPPLRSPGK